MAVRFISTLIAASFLVVAAVCGAQVEAVPASSGFGPADIEINFAGKISAPDGKAAPKASLHVVWMDQRFQPQFRKVDVSADGRFAFKRSLKQVPKHTGGVGVIASAPGVGSIIKTVGWAQLKSRNYALKLETGASLVGRVLGPDGAPVSGAKLALKKLTPAGANRFSGDPENQSIFVFVRSIPPKLLQSVQVATTDSTGHFEMKGLQQGTDAHLSPPDGLMFASGSRTPISISRPVNRAGLLIAMKPGSLKVTLTDPTTGKPTNGAAVNVTPNGPLAFFAVQTASDEGPDFSRMGMNATNDKGEVTIDRLVPGEYTVEAFGLEKPVTIRAGETQSVALSVRGGILKGKVIDAAGKPCANVPITLEIADQLRSLRTAQFAFGGVGPSPVAQSGPEGKFELPTFTWGVKSLTLRATRGNDEAEWTGCPADIKGELTLKLTRGALVTVKGRLVDPQYKPLTASRASAIQWRDDLPRITWLVTAKQTEVDKNGRFAIEGLRRGESFSVLSGSPFMGGRNEDKGFESPRFEVAAPAGLSSQDLGDVVVHPVDGADQILQIYGFESRDQLARLTAVSFPPKDEVVAEAKKALSSYCAAIDRGDLPAVHRATSRLSPGWNADVAHFAQGVTLRGTSAEDIAGSKPIRFLPRFALAYILTIGRAESFLSFNFGAATRTLDENPDWIFFLSGGESNPRSLGLMRREDGEWRVVNIGNFPGGQDELILRGPGRQAGAPARSDVLAPELSDQERKSVEAVGKEYLAAWERDDATRLQQLTSPFSPTWGKDSRAMLRAFERRTDEGRCPSRKKDHALAVLEGLSNWETAWLASYAGSLQELSGGRTPQPRVPTSLQSGYPNAYASRGDIAVVQYESSDGPYLMVLVRIAGDWRVLEAAVPVI